MALMKCAECGGQVSDKASNCPHCGCPVERTAAKCPACGGNRRPFLTFFAIALAVFCLLSGCVHVCPRHGFHFKPGPWFLFGHHVVHRVAGPGTALLPAHPAKFGAAVQKAIGREPDPPPALAGLAEKETRCEVMDADVEAVRGFVAEHALRG